jgi:dephospho-CoA kinase
MELTTEQRKSAAIALKENPLLEPILIEFQAEIINAWRGANSVELREACAAQDKALTRLRARINERIKRELGDKQA